MEELSQAPTQLASPMTSCRASCMDLASCNASPSDPAEHLRSAAAEPPTSRPDAPIGAVRQSYDGSAAKVLYPMLPQYYSELADESVCWVRDDAMRSRLLLRVNEDGRIIDHENRLVASGVVEVAIFVMDQDSNILLTCEHEPQRFYHSSLVAGAPVIAAGEMTISEGRLLSIGNASGHYAPQPSCLSAVMEQLAAIGVTDLQHVDLELTGNPITTQGEFSASPSPSVIRPRSVKATWPVVPAAD